VAARRAAARLERTCPEALVSPWDDVARADPAPVEPERVCWPGWFPRLASHPDRALLESDPAARSGLPAGLCSTEPALFGWMAWAGVVLLLSLLAGFFRYTPGGSEVWPSESRC